MLGLERELDIFVHAVIAGIFVYGSYTGIRLIRRIVKHSIWAISVEDFLFWVATSLYLFICIYKTSGGSVRWFFVVGVLIGMASLALGIFLLGKMWRKIKKSVDKSSETR